MAIKVLIEDQKLKTSPIGDVIRKVVEEANEIKRETHAALDQVRSELRKMGFWTHRGGYHVAIHYKNSNDEPEGDRLALITE